MNTVRDFLSFDPVVSCMYSSRYLVNTVSGDHRSEAGDRRAMAQDCVKQVHLLDAAEFA